MTTPNTPTVVEKLFVCFIELAGCLGFFFIMKDIFRDYHIGIGKSLLLIISVRCMVPYWWKGSK